MAHAVAASSFAAALAPSSGSFSAIAQRKTLSLRTVPCAAVRRCTVSASLSPIEKAEAVLSNADNQKTAAATLAGSVFAMLANAGSASAAQEILSLADSDNRAGALLLVLLPAIGWVLFNILGPAKNQLDKMTGKKKALIGGLGLGAAGALLAPESAEAAQQVADLAADNRAGALLLVLAPALGWVLFNILGPAKNQLNKMTGKKALIGGLGLGAAGALLTPESADAAQQVADLAADNRAGALLLVLAPALGWVLFNILGPAKNQLNKMTGKKALVGGLGLGAAGALLTPESAEAAQQVADLAADNRAGALLLVLAPALGWVLFNILGPAKNQLNKMTQSK